MAAAAAATTQHFAAERSLLYYGDYCGTRDQHFRYIGRERKSSIVCPHVSIHQQQITH